MSVSEERTQWQNPSDVLSVMLVIGGEVVRAALAQVTAPRSHSFAPICFSFGWVTYSFSTLVSAIGDGRLMPEPDYDCKVINGESGYVRENRSWVLGRLLRDHETELGDDGNKRLRVNVFEAVDPEASVHWRMMIIGTAIICLQLGVAAIPLGLYHDWAIFLITAAGTILALITSSLPQWRAEKYSCRTHSRKNFVLTTGNGARHIMIILGKGKCLDLEDLAGGVPPREGRPWEQIGWFTKARWNRDGTPIISPKTGTHHREAILFGGLPVDFLITRVICGTLAVLWIMLLISSSAIKQNAWFLMAVGGIGMIQNAWAAGVRRPSSTRGIFINKVDKFGGKKVMDVLMDLEVAYPGMGKCLLDEFFPGELRQAEKEWWSGSRTQYDTVRMVEHLKRGWPRAVPKPPSIEPSGEVKEENQELKDGVLSPGSSVARVDKQNDSQLV